MTDIEGRSSEDCRSQISAREFEHASERRRLPRTVGEFSVNFCRNSLCDLFGIYPNELDQRGRRGRSKQNSNVGHGKVTGSGNERSYQCPACLRHNSLKSNLAVTEEYQRLLSIYSRTKGIHCPNLHCDNSSFSIDAEPERYRKYGKTASGDTRYQCKGCQKVFSVGRSNRRHKRPDLARKVLRSLMNGSTLSAIARVHDVHIADVYAKIDFIHEQCLEFAKERERELPSCFKGRRPNIAMDTQILMLNWSDKGVRKQVEVRHNCTVERDTGFVIAATTDIDPNISPYVEEELAQIRGERMLPKSMRENARIWFASEYVDYIRKRHNSLRSEPHQAEERLSDKSLLMRCGRVYQDVADYAHILLVKSKLGNTFQHLNVTTDQDAGLYQAYCAIYHEEIRQRKVTVADVTFEKNRPTDYRRALVGRGSSYLKDVLAKMTREGVNSFTGTPVERAMGYLLAELRSSLGEDAFRQKLMEGVSYPFHFVNEPGKRITFRSDPCVLSDEQLGSFVVKAGTHQVDSYHARGRYKIMGFERGVSPSGRSGLYYYKQYYDPVRLFKVVNILRFAHNYMDLMSKNASPAMKLGLARGFVYDRDIV